MTLEQDIKNFKNEEIIHNLNDVKIKNFYASKDIIKRSKGKPQSKKGSNREEFIVKLRKLNYIFLGLFKALEKALAMCSHKKNAFVKFFRPNYDVIL